MLAVFFGVLGIGFINFLVSFSLAFIVAVKSRGIHLSQYPKLFRVIMGYFATHPREFFLPAKKKPVPVYQPLKPADKDQEE
jgi:site-specific recombinase